MGAGAARAAANGGGKGGSGSSEGGDSEGEDGGGEGVGGEGGDRSDQDAPRGRSATLPAPAAPLPPVA